MAGLDIFLSSKWIEKTEDFVDLIVRKSKRFLPFTARFLLVLTFIEDSLRMYFYFDSQVSYLRNVLSVSSQFAAFLVGYNFFAQQIGAVLILLRKFTGFACAILASVIIGQILEYKGYEDLYFVSRSFALLGGLFLLLVESWPEAHVSTASLPSTGEEDRPKNTMQFVARIMVVFMFSTLLRFEINFLQIVYNLLCLPLIFMIAIGYRTKLAALALVVICFVIIVLYYPFWTVPSDDHQFEILKYFCFQICSVIGSLFYIVALGPGHISVEDKKKN